MINSRRHDQWSELSAAGEGNVRAAAVPEAWQPSIRYSDQPMSLGTWLFGMGGVALIALLILGAALFTWTTFQTVRQPTTLSVFDLAPPAAPPEPVHETPPGPEQVQKEKPQPPIEMPQIKPPEIKLPSINTLPVQMAELVPDPGPPVEDTTAPETRPAPPAQQVSTAQPTWEGLVLGALNKVKRYPRAASLRRQQGVPYIRFVMDREGKVLSVRLERSSGFRMLDEEALALPKRASPLPKPPESVAGETIELVVPVEFFMRTR